MNFLEKLVNSDIFWKRYVAWVLILTISVVILVVGITTILITMYFLGAWTFLVILILSFIMATLRL